MSLAMRLSLCAMLAGCQAQQAVDETQAAPGAHMDSAHAMRTQGHARRTHTITADVQVPDPGQGNDIRAALQAALDSASNGDVLRLPAGRFLVSGQVTVRANLRVTIVGQGIRDDVAGTGTRLHFDQARSAGSTIMFQANAGSNPTFADFTIRGAPAAFIDGSIGIRLSQASDFRITRMRIEYFGRAGVSVAHSDTQPSGVIDHNVFFHNVKGDGQGLGYGVAVYGQNQQWIPDARFGSAHFIFIEDNHFERHRHAIAAGGCGLYVARYNRMQDTYIASAIDAHESTPNATPGSSNFHSTRAIEAYGNTIVNTLSKQLTPITPDTVDQNGGDGTLSQFGIGIRGGEALVHHNTIRGYVYGGAIVDNYYASRGDRTYPIASQVGYASGLSQGANHSGRDALNGNGDFFYWANRFTPHPFRAMPWWYAGDRPYFLNYTAAAFREARDYHVSLAADPSGADDSFKPGYRRYTYPHPRAIGGIGRLDPDSPIIDISASAGSEYVWALTLSEPRQALQFSIGGGTGIAEITLGRDRLPSPTAYDCRSDNQPGRNACRLAPAGAGTYYVRVRALTTFSGARLDAGDARPRSRPLPAT
jgi:hypothetical protein